MHAGMQYACMNCQNVKIARQLKSPFLFIIRHCDDVVDNLKFGQDPIEQKCLLGAWNDVEEAEKWLNIKN